MKMKRLGLFIAMFALAIGFSQCKRPNIPVYGSVKQEITFSTANNSNAKGCFEQAGAVLNYHWTDNDKIYVYASADGIFEEGHSTFCGCLDFESCSKEADGSYNGVFSNTVTMPYSFGKVMFVHYGQDVTVNPETGEASVSFAKQNGKLTVTDAEHESGESSVSSKVIASCITDYNEDGIYNSTLVVEFAIVNLSFDNFTAKDEVTFTNIGHTDINVDKYGRITQSGANTSSLENVNDNYCVVFVVPVNTETIYRFDGSEETSHITTSEIKKGVFYTDKASGSPVLLPIDIVLSDIINGAFSIADDTKVYFAKGNLQYQASTKTWRFAEHQYDFVGNNTQGNVYENGVKCDNEKVSATYNGWIDYFAFGTSGKAHSDSVKNKVPCYRPYCTEESGNYYKIYNDLKKNLYDGDGSADWGCNMHGNWYTLSIDEWKYLIDRPDDKSCDFEYGGQKYENCRFLKIGVYYDGTKYINGVLFFPDVFQWTAEMGELPQQKYINKKDLSWGTNVKKYSTTQFAAMEEAGCLFLPAVGYRAYNDGEVNRINNIGDYWTSNYRDNGDAYLFQVTESYVYTKYHSRSFAFTVRLATKVIDTYSNETAENLSVKPW